MSVKVDSYDQKGEKTSQVLDWLAKTQPANPALIAQVIQTFLGNQRRGLAKAKTRGQVDGTTKKLYKQKGTGGARHGSRKAPIFVGGGKAHGPDGRQNYSGKINKKVNRLAFMSTLLGKQQAGLLLVVNCPDFSKTAEAGKYFTAILTEHKQPSALFLVEPSKETEVIKYCHNLNTVLLKDVNSVTTYDLTQAGLILVSQIALASLKNRV